MDGFVASLRSKGLLDETAARRIAEIDERAHLPLARELHALLYLGAVLILAGVGATVKERLDQLGPMTVLAGLGAGSALCFAYCLRLAPPFARGKVESPTAAFDYALYLACGLAGIFVAYLEWKWRLLGDMWDLWLFASGLICVGLAYRFDNRLVLSTGLANLAGWLGVRFHQWRLPDLGMKLAVCAYGTVLIGLAESSRQGDLKPHFEVAYLRFGVNLALFSLAYDADRLSSPWLWTLLAACAAVGTRSLLTRRFETFAYAVAYAYVCSLRALLWDLHGDIVLWTIVFSSAAVMGALLVVRGRFREDA